ncbi:MAG: hypothetical protein K6G10_08910 [Butyrivibrio sp.]|nr:hypothetical protein [Butyrivibrio sp.]
MNRLLAIYAAVIFIISVVIFTIAELNKNNEDETETFKWMKIFSFIGVAIAAVCVIFARNGL